MSEHRWLIALEGRNVDLVHLAEMSPLGSTAVLQDDGSYYLADDDIDALNTIQDVLDQADERLTTLNGIARWRYSRFQPIRLGDPTEIKEDGSRETTRTLAARIVVAVDARATVTVELGAGGPVEPVIPITERAMILAADDPTVARVLHLYGTNGTDPVNLYRIYETVRDDVGGQGGLLRTGWVSKGQISRFTQSVNDPEISGDSARHSVWPHAPHADPMQSWEQESFIRHLVQLWIQSKPLPVSDE